MLAVVEVDVHQIPLELVAQVVVVQGFLGRVQPHLELPTQAVVEVGFGLQTQEQAAQVSSSSRPINNEDKWKPKSIGCMESTPQCTC
jgi:hypothetical protein